LVGVLVVTIASLLPLAIKASLMLMVFGLGLKASASDTLYLFRRPGELVRAFVAMDVVVPLVASALAVTLPLELPVKIALVALSLAPLPPTFSKKPLKAGGTISYTVGLFVAITIIAVGFIPLALFLLNRFTEAALQMSPGAVWTLVLASLLVPLVVGVLVHQIAPAFAERAADPVAKFGTIVLLIAVIPILIRVWPAMISLIGNGHVFAMVVMAVLATAAGHALGGPDFGDRTTLAFASAARHPAIAIAIANANFPDEKLAPAAVLLYLLVSAVVGLPYLKWVGRQRPSVSTATERVRAASK
jgi:bile acid:Na+ symporter, BASS family